MCFISLMQACFAGHLNTVKYLRNCGSTWQSRDTDGCTPLHWAVDGGHLPVITYMIQDGCEVRGQFFNHLLCAKHNTKRIVCLKMSICWELLFIWTDLENFCITWWLAHLWILCIERLPLMRVQIADKNIIIIHTTPVHQLISIEAKSYVFVRNNSVIKAF